MEDNISKSSHHIRKHAYRAIAYVVVYKQIAQIQKKADHFTLSTLNAKFKSGPKYTVDVQLDWLDRMRKIALFPH